jgi:hypothetical protein
MFVAGRRKAVKKCHLTRSFSRSFSIAGVALLLTRISQMNFQVSAGQI